MDSFRGRLGRRLGTRVIAGWQWTIVMPPRPGGWRRRPPQRFAATVIDVSVLGARLRCEELESVGVGSLLQIEADGLTGTVVVRRIAPALVADGLDYGVEFVLLDPNLNDRVAEHLDPARERTQDVWNQAT